MNGRKPNNKLTIETVNTNLLEAEYAVRGDIVARASEISKEIKQGKPYPFNKTVG